MGHEDLVRLVELRNWTVEPNSRGESRLHGEVYGHRRHGDGTSVKLSPVMYWLEKDGKCLVATVSGSVYELMDPKPEYEALFPNAKERLKAAMPTFEQWAAAFFQRGDKVA